MHLNKNFEKSVENYTEHKLPNQWIDTLIQQKYFKLFVPKSLGGLELTLLEGTKKLIETAQIHGGLGWVHNLGAGANYFCGFFDEKTANELFSAPDTILSGSGFNSGTVQSKDSCYIINGAWSKCSGADHASHFTFNAVNEKGETNSYIISKEKVSLTPSWSSFGLKSSSSHSITIKNQSIPKEYLFEIGKQQSFSNYTIYCVPFEQFARICLSATFQGMTESLLNAFKKLDKVPLNVNINKAEEQIQILNNNRNQLAEYYDSTIDFSNQVLKESVNELGIIHAQLFETLMQLYLKGGMTVTEESNLIHWQIRDIMTAIQHYMLK